MILEVLSSIRQEVNKYKFSCDDDVIQCYILEITCGVILLWIWWFVVSKTNKKAILQGNKWINF